MATQAVTSINCPNCQAPLTVPIEQVLDVQSDPGAKSRLLSGQLNTIVCPHCGFQGVLNAPFLYHDADLEMALVYMPMELGMSESERQKAIGDMTNQLMQNLPPEARKGYLLQPRTFLTVQSLIDAMLEKDDETRELVEAQQRRVELIDELSQLDPDDSLAVAAFVGQNDEEIDETFFQLLDLMITIADSRGDEFERERLTQHRDALLERSATGQRLMAQQAAVEALSDNPTRDTLIEQLIANDDREVREALVTVGRGLLDYAFFQALTARIDAAETAGDRETKEMLAALRKEVQEIRDDVDVRARAVLDSRATLLRDLMLAEDPSELLVRHLLEVDDAFFGILATNIRQAESEGRTDVVQQLRRIGDMAVQVLNEFAPPQVQLINRLVTAQNEDEVREVLEEGREYLNEEFLQAIEDTVLDFEQAGRSQTAERLRGASAQIAEMIGAEEVET
jgi:DNA-dependent RNA polymerase auxiliary subunit epsilon